ncbi:MAG: twin transmembrane helix small protein [Pseudomonadota bacterium]
MFIKIAVVLVLIIILGSLFSALFFLNKDKSGSERTVKALTVRIGLSIALFIGLLIAGSFGLIGHSL